MTACRLVAGEPVARGLDAGGLDVHDLARLHDFVQNTFTGLLAWW